MNKTLIRLFAAVLSILSIAVLLSLSALILAENEPRYAEEEFEIVFNEPLYAEEEFEVVFTEDLLAEPEFFDCITDYLHYRFGEQFFINQAAASAAAASIERSFPRSRTTGRRIYPESFGGLYLNRDGNLVVLVVGDDFDARNMAEFAIAEGANIRAVEFSYAELRETWQTTAHFVQRNWLYTDCLVAYNIVSVGVDIINNRVSVYLLDMSTQKIELFRTTVVDHPALVFIQSPGRLCRINDLSA